MYKTGICEQGHRLFQFRGPRNGQESSDERRETRAKHNALVECEYLALGSGLSSLDQPSHPLSLNKAMALICERRSLYKSFPHA